MKGIRRLMAALLAVCIMVAAVPAMKTEAETTFKGSFMAWAGSDCTQAYIQINRTGTVTEYWYKVYDMADLQTPVKTEHTTSCYKVNGKNCVRITGRKSLVTAVRVKAKVDGKWTAWSGYIGIIPLHTSEYCKTSFNRDARYWTITWSKFRGMQDYEVWVSTTGTGGWTMMTRTKGTSYAFKNYKGEAVKRNQHYYIKVIGRAKIGNTIAKAKGDSASYYIWNIWYY